MKDKSSELVGARYKALRKLGEGGQASVWLARDTRTGENVALKILFLPGDKPDEHFARFRREYQVCATLNHPNVIRFLESGSLKDGSVFYAMEYLDCPSLDNLISTKGAFAPNMVAKLGVQIAMGLAHIHEKGIVHRDLKPANVMITAEQRAVIVDFGLAHDDSRTRLTATGALVGTPYYLSPEMINGDPVDPRSDLFQFGTILFEMATGCRPFDEYDLIRLTTRILMGEYGRPPKWNSLPTELVEVIDHLLSPEIADRPSSAKEVLGWDFFRRELADDDLVRLDLPPPSQSAGRPVRRSRRERQSGAHEAGEDRSKSLKPVDDIYPRGWISFIRRPSISGAVVVLVFLAIVGALAWNLPRGEVVSTVVIRDIDTGPDWVRVSWETDGAEGKVRAVVQDGRERVVYGQVEQGREGQGIVSELDASGSYRVWVEELESETRSLEQPVRLQPETAALIVDEQGLILTWREPDSWEGEVFVRTDDDLQPIDVVSGTGFGQWAIPADLTSRRFWDVEIKLSAAHRSRARTISLAAALAGTLRSVGAQARTIGRDEKLLQIVDMRRMVTSDGLAEWLVPDEAEVQRIERDARRERESRLVESRQMVQRRLDELGAASTLEQLRTLIPFVEHGEFVGVEVMSRFIDDLRTLWEFRLRLSSVASHWTFLDPFPQIEQVRCSPDTTIQSDLIIPVVTSDMGLLIGQESPLHRTSTRVFQHNVDIPDPERIRAIALRLETTRFRHIAFELVVGDRIVATVFHEPLFDFPQDGVGTIWQRIPPWFFRQGANRIRFQIREDLARNPRHQVIVEQADLVIEFHR